MTDFGYDTGGDLSLRDAGGTGKAQTLVNITGAAVSLALVLGMGVWGYKLLVRDVSGVPVIEAIEGAFRTQPDDPGGMTAPHQGLQVNEIAAVGTAAGPVDEVRLAPEVVAPSDDDAPWGDLIGHAQMAQAEAEAEAEAARTAEQDDAMIAESAIASDGGQEALELADDTGAVVDRPEDADPIDIAIAEALTSDAAPQVEDAPFIALRPAPRPSRRAAPAVTGVVQTNASSTLSDAEVSIDTLPKGTRLVQLGAYASTDVARAEWARIGGKFVDFFDGKRMVLQEAVSGGKTFIRLRAEGFQDLADARRFCSALTAAQADCIPVEVR